MTTQAGVSCQVIGAGLKDNETAHAVIAFTPWNSAGTAPLEGWPSWAFGQLNNGTLSEVIATPAPVGEVCRWKIKSNVVPNETTLQALDTLWRRLLNPAYNWTEVLDAFSGVAQTGNRTQKVAVPLPTAEAGLAVPLERGRRLLDALAGPGSPLLARAAARPPPRALLALGRPWLDEPGTLTRLASLNTETLSDAQRGLLLGPPPIDDWISALRDGDSEGRKAGDLAYLSTLDPEQMKRDAVGEHGGDMLAVFDRMNALHYNFIRDSSEAKRGLGSAPAVRMVAQLLASPALMRLFGLAFDVELDLHCAARGTLAKEGLWSLVVAGPYGRPCAVKLQRDGVERGFYPPPRAEWTSQQAQTTGERAGIALLPPKAFGLITLESALASAACIAAQNASSGEEAKEAPAHSGGLALVQLQPAQLGAAGPPKGQPPDVLCSDELRVFDRLDIGVVTTAQDEWRCAMLRRVSFADPGKFQIEALLGTLLKASPTPRYELDAAPCGRVTVKAGNTEYQDGRIAIFNGLPGGAAVNEIWWDQGVPKWEHEQVLDPEQNLALDQVVTVPTGANDPKLPRLRFGWRYRVGLRRVWIGGVVRPLSEAAAIYQHLDNACLPSPAAAKDASAGRLYLRHEPINSPSSTLPPTVPSWKQGWPREDELQSPDQAVVVTWTGTPPPGHRTVQTTVRVLFPPRVSLEFASQHEKFDGAVDLMTISMALQPPPDVGATMETFKQHIRVPVDGFRQVQFSTARDGFGDAHRFTLLPQGKREVRSTPYYPDPAACFLAVGLYDPVADTWIEPVKLVRVRGDRPGERDWAWPNLLPVQVELTAVKTTSGKRLEIAPGPQETSWSTDQQPAPSMRVQKVFVKLGPGEQAELRAWYVPSVEDLACWFDLCFSAGELASVAGGDKQAQVTTARDAKTEADVLKITEDACRRGLQALLGSDRCAALERNAGAEPRHHVAALLWAHLAENPIPAVAGVGKITLLHAVRNATAPLAVDGAPLRIVRRLDTGATEVAAFLGNVLGAQGDEDGAVQPVVRGSVMLDLATTSGIVVEAEMASPLESLDQGSPTDDPELVPLDPPANKRFPHEPFPQRNGWPDLTFLNRRVPLLTIRNIPAPDFGTPALRAVSLDDLQRQFANKDTAATPAPQPTAVNPTPAAPPGPQPAPLRAQASLVVQRGTPLIDAGARQATLFVTALPRHAQMLDADPDSAPSVPLQTDPSVSPELNAGQLWMNATIRPAEPDLHLLTPLFDWDIGTSGGHAGEPKIWTSTRTSSLRLELRPPWFSAGEGEELGIIIWPPVLPGTADGQLTPIPNDDTLARLLEEDIGPLGRVVSAWARDPMLATETKTAPERFPMLRSHFDLPHAMWADAALIPVGGGQLEAGLEQEAVASLLRVVPVYDARQRLWYVDIRFESRIAQAISDRFVRLGLVRYQPHARPDRMSGSGLRGIRCSPPVPAWSVLPARRRLLVTLQKAPGKSEGSLVSAVVSGVGDSTEPDGHLPRRAVSFELLEMANGTEWRAENPGVVVPSIETGASIGEPGRTWSAAYHLPLPPHKVLGRYAVRVAEEDVMPSVYSKTRETIQSVKGSLRFSCRIDLK